ncbi:hypothetical protein [Sulfitobacter alexandrii]|uniref:hypothetical protein n=1 Tax=Sulfitobacter alexandrii TaxID=1917485 RepID=UPI0012EBE1A6|nr:hypothetical protein [Sulfitobacter alexandrii]
MIEYRVAKFGGKPVSESKSGQVFNPNESSHSLDLGSLPRDAIKALIEKLNQRSQRVTRVFKSDYDLSVNELKQLMTKILDEFHACSIISNAAAATVVLSKNQRFDFSSWSEFEEFDKSQSQTTKSLTFQITLDVIRGEIETPERYTVQISVQNNPAQFGIQIGPFGIRPVDSFEIPPAPLVAAITFNNYIIGKNLIATVEDWEKSLKKRESPVRKKFQKWSSSINAALVFMATIAGVYACRLPLETVDLNQPKGLGIFLLWSAAVIYSFYTAGSFFASRVEREVDRQLPYNNITLTEGDKRLEEKRSGKNRKTALKAFSYFVAVLVQIGCSLAATGIWKWGTLLATN